MICSKVTWGANCVHTYSNFQTSKKKISNETAVNASLNQPSNLTPRCLSIISFPWPRVARRVAKVTHVAWSWKMHGIFVTESSKYRPYRKIDILKSWGFTNITSWWFQPISKKYARQNGSFPEIGVNIKNIWNHQLDHLQKRHVRKTRVFHEILESCVWKLCHGDIKRCNILLICHRKRLQIYSQIPSNEQVNSLVIIPQQQWTQFGNSVGRF